MESENLVKAKEQLTASNAKTNVAETSDVKARNRYPVKKEGTRKFNPIFDKSWAERVPEHMRNLVYIIHNNTEIRRFTAIGILNYLLQKGEINGDKRYVDFLWNKFRVKVNGMSRDYSYTEPFFLNCLVASFASFSASAQRTINIFCKAELGATIEKAVETEEVNNIIANTESYISDNNNEAE